MRMKLLIVELKEARVEMILDRRLEVKVTKKKMLILIWKTQTT
jgi:hypothetical protein